MLHLHCSACYLVIMLSYQVYFAVPFISARFCFDTVPFLVTCFIACSLAGLIIFL
ncbi:uncharacterized protein F5147DRAFT_704744 [Suillus discolor]|uniref:Uncharacterized protein n=1 Tax=Suillus discolor TaxID=1912936 RepID=A0A9P7JS31_9AGAM|nr:uncharacterized protein F5147DRAFT_704744 [Suillus discolor]KAG2104020.1 hypothetical protein F5147DRAFT_704744 [Suillus discolor]